MSVVLLTFGGQLALADRALYWARLRSEERSVLGVLQAHEQVRRVQPWGMNTDIWLAQVMDLLSKNAPHMSERIVAMQVVLGASMRAAERSEQRPNGLYGVAAAHFSSGNFAAAESSAREAIQMAPRWYKPHWLLARVLAERGQKDGALRAARVAVRLNGGRDANIVAEWESLTLPR